MRFRGIIFDLGGVLCSVDKYQLRAWKALAWSMDIPFDGPLGARLLNATRADGLEILLEKYDGALSEAEKAALTDQKNELFKEYLSEMSPADLSEGAIETLNELRRRRYLLAVGSSSQNAKFILQQIGLGGFFDAISDGTNTVRPKPDPEVFLKAAEMLRLPPESCLVVEDSVLGAQAGRTGGMAVACTGPAAEAGAGNYRLGGLMDLLILLPAPGERSAG